MSGQTCLMKVIVHIGKISRYCFLMWCWIRVMSLCFWHHNHIIRRYGITILSEASWTTVTNWFLLLWKKYQHVLCLTLVAVFLHRHFSIHKLLCMSMQMILCLRTNMIYYQTDFGQNNMKTADVIIRLILKSNLTLIYYFLFRLQSKWLKVTLFPS